MRRNFSKAFKKTTQGNYLGYYSGYYMFIFRRPHGKYCCIIGKRGEWLWSEGYHGTYLDTLTKAKQWAKFKVVPSCTQPI